MTAPVPNPGSDEAVDGGCRCPVMDNGHGRVPPWPPDGWWVHPACPLHGGRSAPPKEAQ